MFLEDAKFQLKLRELQKSNKKVWDHFSPKIDAAREAKQFEEEQLIASEAFWESDQVRDEIHNLQHRYVQKQAERLLIPMPKFKTKDGEWEQSQFDGFWRLNEAALSALAREVRQERRERLELAFLWPSSIIGFVGGLVGIASAFW
ncbi:MULTISPECIES: hypothetical protein [unclassified Leisingera]|uniref:hypothetical protein n=1 Tax=unclassified Leisingera TaxID=2614906 RepID=UPI00037D15FC|nr:MULTISPECIES: hypothetical protein [unclassified Leisingera]KIC17028.1 hypothetical protein RA21_10255 [Leisingera sp. ANG-DT]KIC20479.1 hypothetical protein RA23_21755 [Leisingera sp. ANG-S3]KIC48320.1 hypothetical protein RA22_21450 [Leisingera sp. ANG-S]KID07763.1 hypothetical protein GC1_17245 [Leisingera sp. ANG1]